MSKDQKNAVNGQASKRTIITGADLPEAQRNKILQDTAKMLDAPVGSVDRITITSDHFQVQVGEHTVHIGSVQNLIDQERFRHLLESATGTRIPEFDDAEWAIIASALLAIAEPYGEN